jgi:hypothetical protein
MRLGLALVLVSGLSGCYFHECVDRRRALDFEPEGPGTAAVHVHGSTPSRYEYVAARWLGTATNHGAEPCRLGFYEHAAEPDAESVPVLQRNVAAPATTADGGRLVFETLLPGARDGREFVRSINTGQFGDEFAYGTYLEPDDDEDLEHIDVWLTIATCDRPELAVTVDVIGQVCVGVQRPKGDVKTEQWWPEP